MKILRVPDYMSAAEHWTDIFAWLAYWFGGMIVWIICAAIFLSLLLHALTGLWMRLKG